MMLGDLAHTFIGGIVRRYLSVVQRADVLKALRLYPKFLDRKKITKEDLKHKVILAQMVLAYARAALNYKNKN